jgi:hypothetical protein
MQVRENAAESTGSKGQKELLLTKYKEQINKLTLHFKIKTRVKIKYTQRRSARTAILLASADVRTRLTTPAS